MRRLALSCMTLAVAALVSADCVWAAKCSDECCGRHVRRGHCGAVGIGCGCGLEACEGCTGACETVAICAPAPCECAAPVVQQPVAKPAPVVAPVKPAVPAVPTPAPAPKPPMVAPPKPLPPAPAPAPSKSLPPAPAKVAPPAEKPAEKPAAAKPAAATPPAPPAKPSEQKSRAETKDAAKKVSTFDSGLRTWTDNSGRYRIEARFVCTLANGSMVRLQRTDGSYVRAEFARLCAADRQFVAGISQAIAWNR